MYQAPLITRFRLILYIFIYIVIMIIVFKYKPDVVPLKEQRTVCDMSALLTFGNFFRNSHICTVMFH